MTAFSRLSIKSLSLVILLALFATGFLPGSSISEDKPPTIKEEVKTSLSPETLKALQEKLFLVLESERGQVYVNEINTVKIKLHARGVSVKDVQYPAFSHEGFTGTEFNPPAQKEELVNGILLHTWEFQKGIFAEKAGDYILGPVELQCTLQIGREEKWFSTSRSRKEGVEDYFGTYETVSLTLKSRKVKIRVIALPSKGRPKDFNGAVGEFDLRAEVSPKEVTLGNPVTLTMTVGGKGNFSSVSAPTLDRADGFKIYEPKVVQKQGFKVFEQVLLSLKEVSELPGIQLSFFDPHKKTYRTSRQESLPIKVIKPEKGESGETDRLSSLKAPSGEKETSGRDIIYLKDSPGPWKRSGESLYKNRVFLISQLGAFLVFLSLLALNRKKERMRTDPRYAGTKRASARAKKATRELGKMIREERLEEFYDLLFKTLQAYLSDKFQIPAGGITEEVVSQVLPAKGVSKNLCERLRTLFEECDVARYGSFPLDRSKAEKGFELMKETIRHLERQRP